MEISGSIATPSQGTQAPGAQALPEAAPPAPGQPAAPAPQGTQQGTQTPAGEPNAPSQGQPPAPAPAAASAPAPAPLALPGAPGENKTPNPDTSNTYSYEPTGDAGLDYALNFIGQLGYGDAHPAIIAATKGDFSLIEAELATKNVSGAAQVVALAKQAYERHVQETAKQEAELTAFAANAAGSADNWAVVRAWAAQEATPEEKAQVNAALAQGGIIAQGVITQLVQLYSQKFTLAKTAADVASPNAEGLPGGATEPMTARRYAREVEALRQKLGNRIEGSPEYAALQAQRLAARRAGI